MVILNLGIHAHFTIHLKKISVCSKVFVECIILFGELEDFFKRLKLKLNFFNRVGTT